MKLIRLLLPTLFLIAAAQANSADSAWSAFLSSPNQTSHKALSEKLIECEKPRLAMS